mmetsp:Transcript_11879/g.46404  ORF Transcript_11879/g.46404 Transcript_11879/m.46404 type:complete len:557 (+) Transcript_11879:1799-3469(+)
MAVAVPWGPWLWPQHSHVPACSKALILASRAPPPEEGSAGCVAERAHAPAARASAAARAWAAVGSTPTLTAACAASSSASLASALHSSAANRSASPSRPALLAAAERNSSARRRSAAAASASSAPPALPQPPAAPRHRPASPAEPHSSAAAASTALDRRHARPAAAAASAAASAVAQRTSAQSGFTAGPGVAALAAWALVPGLVLSAPAGSSPSVSSSNSRMPADWSLTQPCSFQLSVIHPLPCDASRTPRAMSCLSLALTAKRPCSPLPLPPAALWAAFPAEPGTSPAASLIASLAASLAAFLVTSSRELKLLASVEAAATRDPASSRNRRVAPRAPALGDPRVAPRGPDRELRSADVTDTTRMRRRPPITAASRSQQPSLPEASCGAASPAADSASRRADHRSGNADPPPASPAEPREEQALCRAAMASIVDRWVTCSVTQPAAASAARSSAGMGCDATSSLTPAAPHRWASDRHPALERSDARRSGSALRMASTAASADDDSNVTCLPPTRCAGAFERPRRRSASLTDQSRRPSPPHRRDPVRSTSLQPPPRP